VAMTLQMTSADPEINPRKIKTILDYKYRMH